jgi:hypothetical protein
MAKKKVHCSKTCFMMLIDFTAYDYNKKILLHVIDMLIYTMKLWNKHF